MLMNSIPRPEHPRPDFMRQPYWNLNGAWQFGFDDEEKGLKEKWYKPEKQLPLEIVVPFAYQSKASGLGPTDEIHQVMWYRRKFEVPELAADERLLLHFGAVDYAAVVYVNGQAAGAHRGGYTPFTLDITALLNDTENDLCLRVEDRPEKWQPRGKQYWQTGLMGCWYTPVSGIWQTVWMEKVGANAIASVHYTPDIETGVAYAELTLEHTPQPDTEVEFLVTMNGKQVKKITTSVTDRISGTAIDLRQSTGELFEVEYWEVDHPALYDVQVSLKAAGKQQDQVQTYFGMRKIEVKNGQIYLNNKRCYQRLILDQGYWPDTLLTPPSDAALQDDLNYIKQFGYNGVRKHQKLEDPRFYYWADKMGLLVWGEVPSAFHFCGEAVCNLAETLSAFIRRDFNHPCIIAWVPMNESWGTYQIASNKKQQELAETLYHLTKTMDGTRLCSSNDGWEQCTTDICALHDYAAEGDVMHRHFATREQVENEGCDCRRAYADGCEPTGKEAFMVTEYGGIAFSNIGIQGDAGGMESWGYHGKVTDEEAFFARYQAVMDAIRNIPDCQGYCYTQLTDVMQEINGLLTPERVPKMDIGRFASINCNPTGRP